MLKDFSLETFDVIIQAGQSNSEGSGFGDVDTPYEVDEDIYYLNADFTISLAREFVFGNQIVSNFSLSFAKEYKKSGCLKDGRKILIVRSAVGGTGFVDNRWGPCDDLFCKMIELTHTVIQLNENNRVIALLWHQGETDADNNVDSETHYANLNKLVELTKESLGNAKLPFIAGDFVNQWKQDNIEKCTPVVDAIRKVCATHGAFVETSDLSSNMQAIGIDDTIHFSRSSLYTLGKRYFNALISLQNNIEER